MDFYKNTLLVLGRGHWVTFGEIIAKVRWSAGAKISLYLLFLCGMATAKSKNGIIAIPLWWEFFDFEFHIIQIQKEYMPQFAYAPV